MAQALTGDNPVISQSQNSNSIGQYEKFELTFTLEGNYSNPSETATYKNPFDADQIKVDVTFIQPDGTSKVVPAFYYMEYDITAGNPERYGNGRNPSWKARFAPTQFGTHSYTISVTDSIGTQTIPGANSFQCVSSAKKGFIRIDSRDHSLLRRTTGEQFAPIGYNQICAGNNTGLAWWTAHFQKMHDNGVTWERVWMSSYNTGENIEWTPKNITSPPPYYHGVGQYGLEISWRLDRVIELAEQNGVAIQLVLQYFQQFLNYDEWRNNPYNSANSDYGGWLTNPQQFFTDAEAIRLTKNKYRYIIARWGYSTSVQSWELFNEVMYSSGAASNRNAIVAWHEEMARFIKELDPFDHPITTSVEAGYTEANETPFWSLSNMDIIQLHSYTTDIFAYLKSSTEKLRQYGKPIFTGEFGLGADDDAPELTYSSFSEPYRSQLAEGLHLHNIIWESLFLKSSAHIWYASYVGGSLRLYQLFKPPFLFMDGETWGDEGLINTEVQVTTQTMARETVVRSNLPGLINFYDVPQQRIFNVDQYGQIEDFEKMTVNLHGTIQESLRSDPIFHTNFDAPATIKLIIPSVSNYAYLPSSMEILVDGVVAASLAPAAGASNLELEASIPAGTHTIQVKNTGRDWFYIKDYSFSCPTSVAFNSHILQNISLVGNNSAYLWVYDIGSQYGLENNGVISNTTFTLPGLSAGTYKIQYYNTWGTGGLISEGQVQTVGGVLTGSIPSFSKDIAIKIKPTTASGCTENWTCGSWSACSNNSQIRTCTDSNGCGTVANRPALSQTCASSGSDCTENWTCGSWSACSGNNQTRTCADSSSCGTVANRPALSQTCASACTPKWGCTAWMACSNGTQIRTCTDSHGCKQNSTRPAESQPCGSSIIESSSTASTVGKGIYTAGRMIKVANNPAVYHVTDDNKRHLYVNEATYWTWHTGAWAQQKVEVINQATFDALTEGDHVRANPGSNLISFDNSPRVYMVFGNNNLKYISEQEAADIFGEKWKNRLIIIQSSFENDYIRNDAGFIDSDKDGLADSDETNIYNTQPANADSDGDGYKDGREALFRYNPNLKD
ncbi:MAG: DUF5060 domain-containing protein [Patescibacteria group bacterium]